MHFCYITVLLIGAIIRLFKVEASAFNLKHNHWFVCSDESHSGRVWLFADVLSSYTCADIVTVITYAVCSFYMNAAVPLRVCTITNLRIGKPIGRALNLSASWMFCLSCPHPSQT